MIRQSRRILVLAVLLFTAAIASAQTTYTWSGSGSWQTTTNWTPTRSTPATNDILVFNGGGAITVTGVPVQTIGKLQVTGNTAVTLQPAATATTLTISGGSGALSVDAGSQLNISGTNTLTITLPAGSNGTVSGAMTFTNAAHKLTAADASGITFQSGATFTAGTSFSSNPFGTTANTVVFASGSTFVFVAGSTPFPASVFQSGSLFSQQGTGTPSFSGRTYADFELKSAAATITVTGGSAVSIDNLTITQGTLNFNMTGTPGHAIKKNISIAAGATLNFTPASAGTVNLNGSAAQTITNSGTLTFGANSTINVNNSSGVSLGSNVSMSAGTLALANGKLDTGANKLTIGSSAAVTRTNGWITGNLTKTFAATGSKTFEVGSANGYSPVTVNVTGGSGDFNVIATQSAQPSVPAATSLARYWTLSTASVTAADLTFQYLAGDVSGSEAAYKAINVSGGSPAYFASSTVNTSAHTVSVANVTSFATDWTAGESNAPANVTSVGVPANATYAPGQHLDFTASFDETVFVTGTPRIPVALNTGTVYANYVSGSGSTALLFRYTVASGDGDPDGISVGAALDLNGGTIQNSNVVDALTALNNVANTTGVLVDGLPPNVSSITRAGASPTAQPSVDFTVTFNEAVTGIDASDFTLTTTGISAASISGVSGSGTTYTVTASTGTGTSGTLRLDLVPGATFSDAYGNAYAGSGFTAGETYTIDKNAPAVQSVVRANANPTNAASISYTVTFTQSVTGVDASDFALTTTGISGASVSGVSGSGSAYTVTVNSGSGDGTLRLDVLNDGTIQSATSVPLTAGFTTGEVYTIDKTAPSVMSIARVGAATTNAASVQFTVTFSESVSGVDASDFTLGTTGISGASVTNVSGSGAVYTVTAGSGTGDGTLRLDFVSDGSVLDAAGNATTSGFTTGDSDTIDKTAPAVVSIVKASADPSTAATVDFTVTFSEAVTGVDATDFAITAPGLTGTSVANVAGSGTAYTITVNTGSGNGALRLDFVSDGSVIDVAGNSAATFTAGESYTMQGTAATPTGVSATPGDTQVALSWSAASGATSYNVKRATVSGGPYAIINSPSGTSYNDTSVTNGTPYFYVISANGVRGESGNSSEVSATPAAPSASSFGVVISQIYGGGGNSGATYKNDFVELFNRGNATVNLTGWSVQYSSATGSSWQVTNLSGSIAPGHYYLVQEAAGAGGTTNLPTPDATGTINMSGTAGKVVLANVTTAFSGCATGSTVADLVGFGSTANCSETSPTPAPSNTNSVSRANNGCTDTNNNNADFTAGLANPRNSTSFFSCSGFALNGSATPSTLLAGDATLIAVNVTPGTNPAGTGIAVTANLAPIGGSATQTLYDDGTNGDVTPGDNVFSFATTVAPATTPGVATIQVSATDAQARATSSSFTITVMPSSVTNIADAKLDANADSVPDTLGQFLKVRGVVTSIDFRSGTGVDYYIQDPTGGIDVFNSTTDFGPFTIGTNVEVVGTIAQFNGLSEIIPSSMTTLPGGTLPAVTPQVVTLAQLADGAGEPYEGTLVQVNNVTITSGAFPAGGASGNVTISDGTGTGTLRVNSATDIDGTTAPSGVFVLTGVVSQSDTTNPFTCCYQVQPRALADIALQTAPSGSGTATPSSVIPGGTTLLTVAVTPGANPSSTGITVTADLTPIGGAAGQALFDDGTHGDATPNDGTYSLSVVVDAATTLGGKSIPIAIADAQSRTSSASIALTIQSATAPNPPTALTATPGNNQVGLSWTGSAGASGYNVQRATVSGGPYTTIAPNVVPTSYTDTSVSNGTRYYYVVTATNGNESGPSNEANAMPTAPPPSGSLAKIYFVDIGQGASTLIVSPTGKSLLVDGGPTGQGTQKLIPLLNTLGIATIDYTILTHYHIDHDDGLTEVINAGRVAGTAYDNGDSTALIPPNSGGTMTAYQNYVAALNAHSGTITRQLATPGTVINLGGGMQATILAQGGTLLSGGSVTISNSDLNTESISTLVEFGNFDFLVSGDLTGGGSTDTAKTPDVETFVGQMAGDVDVVEFDHHGSTTANNRRFLRLLKAEAAFAEAGYTNTFGHPNRETVNKYLNTPTTAGNTYGGTSLPNPGTGPVAYQTDPSPAGDQRCTVQGYSGAAAANAGNGTLLLQTDGSTSFSLGSFDDGGARISPAAHVYALDGAGAGLTNNFPPTVIPSINPAVPTASDVVTVSALVNDREDPITSVTLNYSINGVAQTPVAMALAGGSTYQATIAAQPDATRIDYSVSAVAGGGTTTYASGYFAGTTPISTLRALDALGEPQYLDYAARVQGTVTSGTGNYASGTNDDYLQDATGGINIFRTIQPATPAVQTTTTGGVYSVAGLIGENGGRLRLEVTPRFTDTTSTPYGCTFVTNGSVPAPLVKTIAQLNANPESLEAQLVQINNCTVTSGTIPASPAAIDGFLTVSDGTGSFQLKIDHNTDIPGMATPSGSFTITGIIQQDDFLRPFDSNYDVAPRNRVDLGGTPTSGPGVITIADARVDVDAGGLTPGDYVPDRLGQTVHIQGVVTSINFRTSNGSGIEYYIQDATAGVDIFSTATTRSFSIGDNLDVIGTVKQFNGLTEIDPGATLANLAVLPAGSLPAVAPALVTCSKLADSGAGEPLEGRLLRLNNVTLTTPPATWAASTNYAISDSTGPCTIRVSASTNLVGQAAPAGTFSIVGVLGQFDSTAPYDSGYQLFPRSTSDLLPAVPAAASIVATAGTPQSAAINSAFATQLAATVKDSGSAPISGAGVTFTAPVTGASGTFAGGATSVSVITDASGVATAPAFTANGVTGAYSVVASTVNSLTASFSLTNLAAPPTHFSVTAPANVTAGTAFSVTVTALDAANATVTGYLGTVHFTSSSAGTLPADYAFTAGDGGTHTFSVTLTTNGAQTITASDGSISGTGNTSVAAVAATHFSVTAPANVTSGAAFSVTVTALDASNATVTGYSGTIHFTSSSAGTLPADYTFVAGDNGAHSFSVTLTTNGAQTITASDGTISGTGNTTVSAPPATHLSISAPANVTTGASFSVAVTALDASNATVTGYNGTIHFTSSSAGTLPANYTFVAADDGTHTFSATLTTTGTQTLSASDGTIGGSASISVGCPLLSVTAANNGPVCAGGSVQLTATTAASGVTFSWSGPNGFTSAQQNPTVTAGGTYTVTMTNAQGCIASSSTTVTVNALPSVTITAPATLCAHESRVTASATAIAGATYAWSISDGTIIGATNTPSVLFNAGASGHLVLSVTVHSAAGCAATATKSITVEPRPTATLPAQLAMCGAGNVTIPVTLTGTAPFTLVWSDGVTQSGILTTTTSRTVAVSATTSLSIVSVTDASCSGSESNVLSIAVDTQPSIKKQPQDTNVKPGDSATLSVTATGTNLRYAWFAGAAGDTSAPVGSDSASYTTAPITAKQTFWVRVSNGCGSVDSVVATVTPVPPRPHPAKH